MILSLEGIFISSLYFFFSFISYLLTHLLTYFIIYLDDILFETDNLLSCLSSLLSYQLNSLYISTSPLLPSFWDINHPLDRLNENNNNDNNNKSISLFSSIFKYSIQFPYNSIKTLQKDLIKCGFDEIQFLNLTASIESNYSNLNDMKIVIARVR